MTEIVETHVTYAHSSAEGAVYVITDVPALVYQSPEGRRDVRYKAASSRVVNACIRAALKTPRAPQVYMTSFAEAQQNPAVAWQTAPQPQH